MREARSALPKKPARAVTKIRKVKIEKRKRKAILPASGIASSANNRLMASKRSRAKEGRGSVMRKAYQRQGFDSRIFSALPGGLPDRFPHPTGTGSLRASVSTLVLS